MKKNITFSNSGISQIKRELEKAEKAPIRHLLATIGAIYNEDTDSYCLNSIDDIKEEDALEIFCHKEAINNLDLPQTLQNCNIRTIVPCHTPVGTRLKNRPLQGEYTFAYTPAEILKFGTTQEIDSTNEDNMLPATGLTGTFCNCTKLHTVFPINVTDITTIGSDTFSGCENMSELRLYGLGATIKIQECSQISYASLLYIVTNAANSKEINITVSSSHYRYLHKLSTPPESIGGSSDEWAKLRTRALRKNITFATLEFIVFVEENVLNISTATVSLNSVLVSSKYIDTSNNTLVFL